MEPKNEQAKPGIAPGTWSTDDYIRRWARGRGMNHGICAITLQSLHDSWTARINFDRKGHPVERVVEPGPQIFQTSDACCR
jgi:hypothetical protein